MYLANFSSLGDSGLVDQLGLVGLVAQVKVSLLQLPFRGSQVLQSYMQHISLCSLHRLRVWHETIPSCSDTRSILACS
jgi:hypothetical protein